MRVELHDGLKDGQSIQATRVIVYDDHDNPIAVVIQVDGSHYVAATAANKQFNNVLKAMGIQKSVIVSHLDPNKLKTLD